MFRAACKRRDRSPLIDADTNARRQSIRHATSRSLRFANPRVRTDRRGVMYPGETSWQLIDDLRWFFSGLFVVDRIFCSDGISNFLDDRFLQRVPGIICGGAVLPQSKRIGPRSLWITGMFENASTRLISIIYQFGSHRINNFPRFSHKL